MITFISKQLKIYLKKLCIGNYNIRENETELNHKITCGHNITRGKIMLRSKSTKFFLDSSEVVGNFNLTNSS